MPGRGRCGPVVGLWSCSVVVAPGLSAVPVPDPTVRGKRTRIVLEGDVPSPADPPSGCRFRTRCWKAEERCAQEEPPLERRGHDHPSACHFAEVRDVVSTGTDFS